MAPPVVLAKILRAEVPKYNYSCLFMLSRRIFGRIAPKYEYV